MELKLKLEEGVEMPQYETEGAAGFDMRAIRVLAAYMGDRPRDPETVEKINQDFKEGRLKIRGHERILFGTGICADIPEGYEIQIRPRSGMALKQGLTVINSPGTIDSDYKKEIGVIVQNTSDFLTAIGYNTRIAQDVVKDVVRPILVETQDIEENQRGGFGSTGVA